MLVCPLCRIVLSADQPSCPRDGTAGVEHAIEAIPGELAQRFAVVEVFAAGETGTLYLADEPQTGRRGLLKVLPSPGPAHAAERQRVKRELVKQATLSNANLALPQATGEAGAATWLFREWIDGVSLRVRLARSGALPMPEALAIAAQLATALDELHRAGLLHRDLKPGHVLLQAQPNGLSRVLVIDSGIAAHVRSTQVFDVLGTAAYVSPEQATGKLVSFRSDLYSLGCVLYEMLAGKPPFTGDDAALLEAHATQAVPPLPVHLPTGVQSLLTSLLAKEPRERPFSAQQVRRALEPFLPEATSTSREVTMAFDHATSAAAAIDAVRAGAAARGTGTLRPPDGTLLGMPAVSIDSASSPSSNGSSVTQPQKPKSSTMIGMPAVVVPSNTRPPPPPPPPMGAQDLRVTPPSKPPPPPPPGGAPRPDSTEELSAIDVEEAEHVLAAKSPEDLDYDELAETKAVDVQRVLQQGLAAASAPAQVAPGFAAPQQGYAAPPQAGYPAPSQQGYGAPQQAVYGTPQSQGYAAPGAPTTPGGYSSPGMQSSPGAYATQAPAKKKKSKLGLFILAALLGVCFLTSAAGVGGYYYLSSKVDEVVNMPIGLGPIGGPGAGTNPFNAGPSTGLPDTLPGVPTNPAIAPTAPGVPTAVPIAPIAPVVPAEPSRVTLNLNTTPAGATAIVDDGERCTTPCDLQVTAGPHNLRFELAGHVGRNEVVDTTRTGAVSYSLQATEPPPVVATNDGPTRGGTTGTGTTGTGTTARTGTTGTGTTGTGTTGTGTTGTGTTGTGTTGTTARTGTTGTGTTGTGTTARTGTTGTGTTGTGTTGTGTTTRTGTTGTGTTGTGTTGTGTTGTGTTGTTGTAAAQSPFDALRESARGHFSAGRFREAAAAYERAAALNPSHAGTFAGLGASRMQLHDARGAVAAYEKAVQLQPTSAGFLAALGRAHVAAGNRDRARAAFQRALSIDPNNAAARQGMQQVGG